MSKLTKGLKVFRDHSRGKKVFVVTSIGRIVFVAPSTGKTQLVTRALERERGAKSMKSLMTKARTWLHFTLRRTKRRRPSLSKWKSFLKEKQSTTRLNSSRALWRSCPMLTRATTAPGCSKPPKNVFEAFDHLSNHLRSVLPCDFWLILCLKRGIITRIIEFWETFCTMCSNLSKSHRVN